MHILSVAYSWETRLTFIVYQGKNDGGEPLQNMFYNIWGLQFGVEK